MKVTKKVAQKPDENTVVSKLNTVSDSELGIVKLTHHQSVRQSANYQSADCSYSVSLAVEDSEKNIRKGFRRMERIVEDHLVDKIKQQTKLLDVLGTQNR